MPFSEMTITGIWDVVTVPLEKNQTVAVTNRKTYGLTLCKSGKATYVQDGVPYVSDPYTVLLLPQDKSYALTCSKTGYFPVINFTADHFLADHLMEFPLDTNDVFFELFDRMRILQDLPDNRLEQMGLLYTFFGRLQNMSQPRRNRALEAAEYIQKNLGDPELSNKSIAQAHHISEVYLRKLFIREFDTSPRQYLLQMRIANAKRILEEQDITVSSVAEKCGYSTVYHFCRSFKHITGITPSDYRARSREMYL